MRIKEGALYIVDGHSRVWLPCGHGCVYNDLAVRALEMRESVECGIYVPPKIHILDEGTTKMGS